ncbi:TetR/AcrR family transcriptional regulator [uncultured Paracoccus sp.]|uniref:TetR/AcrR family transcriptional regulator n=1 Tax=uncultured Paracoccus sp. TaxID=189685 RepID=UPI002601C6E1|nr:TetR/AcrR family transcriptional regulator [uncultured Paracoccus sp.]
MPTHSTRELIVEQADALFYEGGYEATSFAEIAAAVGISRGNFYHHFKTKDDILDAVITRRIETTRALLDGWQAEGVDPRARILSFIRLVIANRAKIMAFGCPVGTLSLELAKLDHVAQDRAAEVFGLFRDWLVRQFRALGAGERSEALALHLLVWSQGVAVMASSLRDETIIPREVEGIDHWLATLPDLAPAR